MDLYCLKFQMPMCNTCSNSYHDCHKRCELEKQGAECKKKLEQTSKDTDRLIDHAKEAMMKTKQQAQQAERDIDDACDNINSVFEVIYDKFIDREESKMLSEMKNIHTRVKKTVDVTADGQSMTLASLQSTRACQV